MDYKGPRRASSHPVSLRSANLQGNDQDRPPPSRPEKSFATAGKYRSEQN